MAAYNSSSLGFSDGDGLRKSLLKPPTRISKQNIVEHKMFGSKRGKTGKDFGLSRKFRKGKSSKLMGDMKSSAISPSVEEFDKMMNNLVGKKSSNKKMFNRKQFG